MVINKTASTNKVVRQAIKQTVLYSDLFEFPLNLQELWYFLKSKKKIAKTDFLFGIRSLPEGVSQWEKYYYLIPHKAYIHIRKKRGEYSREKVKIAKNAAHWLSLIPTVQFIGISGSAALGNADKNDDIDVFVIVSKNSMWITRLFCLLILQMLGLRRNKDSMREINTICMNMFIDVSQLQLPKLRQDIYTAHEIAQLMPLLNRNNSYQQFLLANNWLSNYMPNVLEKVSLRQLKPKNQRQSTYHTFITLSRQIVRLHSFDFFNSITRIFQLWSINRTRTNETISNSLLAFHPFDYRRRILRAYNEKLKEYGIG